MSGFNKCFIISIVMCFVVNVTCELTVDVAYSMLERRIENLEMDTFSGMAKINDRMDSIEVLIKSQMTSQPLPNKDSDRGPVNKHVDAHKDVRKVKATVLKAFASEKHHIRNVLEKCEEQIMDFKQIVNEHMRQLNDSYEAIQNEHIVTTARINDSLKQFKLNTDLQLEGIVVDFQTALNNTDITLETTIVKQDNLQTLTKNIEKDLNSQKNDISSINSGLSSINSGLSSTKNDVSSVKRDISSINSGMSSMRRDISSGQSDLSSTERGLSSAKSDISSVRSRINTLEDKRVGFTARLTNVLSNYAKNKIIVFNDLESSYGGGYSTSTGKFTAPKSGLYLFQFNVQAYGSQEIHASLYVDGSYKASAIVEEGPNMTGSNTAVAYMDRGDIACVQTAPLESTYGIWPYQTSFTGVLIH